MLSVIMLRLIKKGKYYCFGLMHYCCFIIKSIFLSDEKLLPSIKYIIYHRILYFSINKYLKIKKHVELKNIRRIKERKKIRVGFVLYSSSIWFLDELFVLLDKQSKFQPYIIIGHLIMNDYASSDNEYKKTFQYFNRLNYKILTAERIENLDLLFYLTPFPFYENKLNIENISLTHLVYHVSYSYMLAGNSKKLLLNMYHWSFRYYTDSEYYLKQLKNTNIYSDNGRYLGYPKMDQYYKTQNLRISDKITIIYAPHHSVNYTEYKSATFDKNYKFMLEIIKKYKEKVYWIYKPHPLLRDHCIKAKIFSSYKDYDNYIDELKNTKCVDIADEGNYFDKFKASDAMITDSVSFLAEYQFTQKPLLLLMSGMEKYNDFGQSIVNILYKCNGDDFYEIISFIEKVINNIDPMKEKRIQFFKNNLDYIGTSNQNANTRIYNDIIETLC